MVEKRLIDANELLKDARQCRAVLASLADIVDIEILVTDQPTVDAVEVVHGRWEKVYDELGIDRGWKCSCCNRIVYHMTYEPYEYCPHCGAEMR